MRVLIIGNSQTVAIARGYKDLVASGLAHPGLEIEFQYIGMGRELQEKFYSVSGNEFSTHSRKTVPFTFSGGVADYDIVGLAAPYFSSLLCKDPDWMSFGLAPNCEGKTPLSRHLVEQATSLGQRHVLAFLDALQAVGTPVFAVEAARLFRESPLVQRNDEALVAQIDAIFCQTMAEELQRRSIRSVRVPKESCDELGYLLSEHRSHKKGDTVHANRNFGVLMARQINAFLAQA